MSTQVEGQSVSLNDAKPALAADAVKHTIHFGETASFVVNEWLYNYFNSIKNNPKEYNKLYNILSGMKHSICR